MTLNLGLFADALAEGAARHHGPAFHLRGGGVGRARSLVNNKGMSVQDAVLLASKQAKGHAAELAISVQLTTRAGIAGVPAVTRPNNVANDPHIDVEVVAGKLRVNDAQVGVGKPDYVAQKARSSQATQVVINCEAREVLATRDGVAHARTSERMTHRGLASDVVSEELAVRDAVIDMTRALEGNTHVGFFPKSTIAFSAGAQSALVGGCTTALCEVVERLVTKVPIDGTVFDAALAAGTRSFLTTGLQTYAALSEYLNAANGAFRARILHLVASKACWAGAVADFVVSTARDVVRWARNEIDFDELLRRAGVTAFAVTGAAVAGVAVAQALSGAPWWLQILLGAAAAWAGGKAGGAIGRELFKPLALPAREVR